MIQIQVTMKTIDSEQQNKFEILRRNINDLFLYIYKMNQQVIFNAKKTTNEALFERNNLIFTEFHNSDLQEPLRSKQSTNKEDKRKSLNFNDHLMIQRGGGLGHSLNKNPLTNYNISDNTGSNHNLSSFESIGKDYFSQNEKTQQPPKLDKSLPSNIYHNFSISDRNGYWWR